MSMKLIKEWAGKVSTYPPAEIFFDCYGKAAKAEERIKDLCEPVYRFCVPEGTKHPTSDFKAALRDFEVLHNINLTVKEEYIQKVSERLTEEAKLMIPHLDSLFKKDPVLANYYSAWKVKFQDIKTWIYDATKEIKNVTNS